MKTQTITKTVFFASRAKARAELKVMKEHGVPSKFVDQGADKEAGKRWSVVYESVISDFKDTVSDKIDIASLTNNGDQDFDSVFDKLDVLKEIANDENYIKDIEIEAKPAILSINRTNASNDLESSKAYFTENLKQAKRNSRNPNINRVAVYRKRSKLAA